MMPRDRLSEDFLKDRADFMGPAAMQPIKGARLVASDQLRLALQWIEDQLADGRTWYLDSQEPSHADVHVAYNLWSGLCRRRSAPV